MPVSHASENRKPDSYMREALELAKRGFGFVQPNPMVGAVLVRDGQVIGRGYHALYGGPHAEVVAIADARSRGYNDLRKTALHVTLEPCCHQGKTPPCTGLILSCGIPEVVAGTMDPNPLVAGKGVAQLRAAGVRVTVGVLEKECRELNRGYFTRMTEGRPFCLLKAAVSLDGRIATATGESRWISSVESRRDAHLLRAEHTAVMCGIGTALADDPLLTVRDAVVPLGAARPLRIVVDSSLRLPLGSRLAATVSEAPLALAVLDPESARAAGKAPPDDEKARALKNLGADIIPCPATGVHVNLSFLMRKLAEQGIDTVLLEGGGELAFSALSAGVVDRVRYYVAPILLGGCAARGAVGGIGFPSLTDAPRLEGLRTEQLGPDLVLEADICSRGS